MSKKLSDGVIELIQGLYSQGLSVAEVSRRINVSYSTVYSHTRARQRINPETGQPFKSGNQYEDYLARQRGFASRGEYQRHQFREKQKRPENKTLSSLIRKRLRELDKSQRWLAKQLGITEGAVSRYVSGKNIPKKNLQPKLFETLDVPYKTIDDLLE